MKIGIHEVVGSFSDGWISYCKLNNIEYKLVDCYKSNIIQQLSDCDALMWHFSHLSAKDNNFAKQLLYSVEASGKKVFPNFTTVWHFDDKVGQKYLLEAIGIPMVPTYVFYRKSESLDWINNAHLPKVTKLRTGAGSDSVRLVRTKAEAKRIIRKSFGIGFKPYDSWRDLRERVRLYRIGKLNLWSVIKGVIRLVNEPQYSKVAGREKGYIYFQDFIPDNDHDIRVVVIGKKAVALKRLVRNNDFRASGSGHILYERDLFDENTIRLSFEAARKLEMQCVAFDYVHDKGKPLLVEISYGFSPKGYDPCPGYWDDSLKWHDETPDLYGWMVEGLTG